MAGDGVITANGATGFGAGSGSGGRIAVHCSTSSFSGTITAFGGREYLGGPGTVFFRNITSGFTTLTINNNNTGNITGEYIPMVITSVQNVTGEIAWLTEAGVSQINISEVILKNYGSLAILPTAIPSNETVSLTEFLFFIIT